MGGCKPYRKMLALFLKMLAGGFVVAPVKERVMLNVRVDPKVMHRLDSKVAELRRGGRRVTKESLVSEAILTTYPDASEETVLPLPVHEGRLLVDYDPYSSNSLLNAVEEQEDFEFAQKLLRAA
jgi:hypothetical protein